MAPGVPPLAENESWFEVTELGGGVKKLVEPYVHDFFRANLYFIEGRDFDVMLDFGSGVSPLRPVLPSTGRPVMAIATHAHIDHIGCFHEFDWRAGHAAEADIFGAMDDAGTLASWFCKHEAALARWPATGFSLETYQVPKAPLTQVLTAGDVVDLGNRRFRVLHLPGHSPGSIGLLDEHDGTLFAGDAIYDGGLVDDIPGADRAIYRQTMAFLAGLDVSIVHAGHCPPFDRARMEEIARAYIARTE